MAGKLVVLDLTVLLEFPSEMSIRNLERFNNRISLTFCVENTKIASVFHPAQSPLQRSSVSA